MAFNIIVFFLLGKTVLNGTFTFIRQFKNILFTELTEPLSPKLPIGNFMFKNFMFKNLNSYRKYKHKN